MSQSPPKDTAGSSSMSIVIKAKKSCPLILLLVRWTNWLCRASASKRSGGNVPANFSLIFPANCLGSRFIVMRIALLDDVICAKHIVRDDLMMSKTSDHAQFPGHAFVSLMHMGMEPPVATGYDPLRDTAPELARTMAASVQQRIACGERAGQPVRRIGAGFGHEGEAPRLTGPRCASVHGFSLHANTAIPAHRRDQLECLIRYTARGAVSLERLEQDANGDLIYTFTHPWSDGTTGIRLAPLELLEKLAALVPLPRVHLVRYGGCLAPHSYLRGVIRPTLRQQGLDGEEAQPSTPYWPWAKLLGRVFGLEMATCPFCRRGALRIIAVITQESVITRILRHLQLASVPPPIAPPCLRQACSVFD